MIKVAPPYISSSVYTRYTWEKSYLGARAHFLRLKYCRFGASVESILSILGGESSIMLNYLPQILRNFVGIYRITFRVRITIVQRVSRYDLILDTVFSDFIPYLIQ